MPASPRTILYLTPSTRLLGARHSLAALATHLDPQRYRPLVICPSGGELADLLERSGVPVRYVPLYNWRKGRYFLHIPFSVRALRRIAREEGAALVHSNEFWCHPYGAAVGRKLGIPAITHVRLAIAPDKVRKYHIDEAARVIVVSAAAGRDLDHWRGKERIRVVHNGVDVSKFHPGVDGSEIRRAAGFGSEHVVILQAGLISVRKRQETTIRAAEIVRRADPRCRFLIVGKPRIRQEDYERQMRRLVAEKNLGDIVAFMPFREDVERVYAAADINVLPSIAEGCPRVVIEAGATGVPTIGSRVGGIPEEIDHGESGMLVEPDSPDELAEAILALAGDEPLRRRMGENARRTALERFSIESHTRKIQDIYDEVLAGR